MVEQAVRECDVFARGDGGPVRAGRLRRPKSASGAGTSLARNGGDLERLVEHTLSYLSEWQPRPRTPFNKELLTSVDEGLKHLKSHLDKSCASNLHPAAASSPSYVDLSAQQAATLKSSGPMRKSRAYSDRYRAQVIMDASEKFSAHYAHEHKHDNVNADQSQASAEIPRTMSHHSTHGGNNGYMRRPSSAFAGRSRSSRQPTGTSVGQQEQTTSAWQSVCDAFETTFGKGERFREDTADAAFLRRQHESFGARGGGTSTPASSGSGGSTGAGGGNQRKAHIVQLSSSPQERGGRQFDSSKEVSPQHPKDAQFEIQSSIGKCVPQSPPNAPSLAPIPRGLMFEHQDIDSAQRRVRSPTMHSSLDLEKRKQQTMYSPFKQRTKTPSFLRKEPSPDLAEDITALCDTNANARVPYEQLQNVLRAHAVPVSSLEFSRFVRALDPLGRGSVDSSVLKERMLKPPGDVNKAPTKNPTFESGQTSSLMVDDIPPLTTPPHEQPNALYNPTSTESVLSRFTNGSGERVSKNQGVDFGFGNKRNKHTHSLDYEANPPNERHDVLDEVPLFRHRKQVCGRNNSESRPSPGHAWGNLPSALRDSTIDTTDFFVDDSELQRTTKRRFLHKGGADAGWSRISDIAAGRGANTAQHGNTDQFPHKIGKRCNRLFVQPRKSFLHEQRNKTDLQLSMEHPREFLSSSWSSYAGLASKPTHQERKRALSVPYIPHDADASGVAIAQSTSSIHDPVCFAMDDETSGGLSHAQTPVEVDAFSGAAGVSSRRMLRARGPGDVVGPSDPKCVGIRLLPHTFDTDRTMGRSLRWSRAWTSPSVKSCDLSSTSSRSSSSGTRDSSSSQEFSEDTHSTVVPPGSFYVTRKHKNSPFTSETSHQGSSLFGSGVLTPWSDAPAVASFATSVTGSRTRRHYRAAAAESPVRRALSGWSRSDSDSGKSVRPKGASGRQMTSSRDFLRAAHFASKPQVTPKVGTQLSASTQAIVREIVGKTSFSTLS